MPWLLYASLLSLLASGDKAVAGNVSDDLKLMQGRWILVQHVEISDRNRPRPKLDGAFLEVKGNTLIFVAPNGNRERCRFRLNSTTSPKQIDILPSRGGGPVSLGIYEVSDRILILYFGDSEEPLRRPSDFLPEVAKFGQTYTLTICERETARSK
jgi:uncharacterized protein (TIGR03067 family)